MTNQCRILPRCVAQIIRWKGNRDIKLSDTKKHSDQLKLCAYNIKAILQRLMVNWRGLQGKNHYSLSIEQDEGGVPLCPFEHTNKKQNKFVDLGRYLSSVAVQCHQCQQGPTISTKSDILATIQNHSRTPKTCFTLSLEFFWYIYLGHTFSVSLFLNTSLTLWHLPTGKIVLAHILMQTDISPDIFKFLHMTKLCCYQEHE